MKIPLFIILPLTGLVSCDRKMPPVAQELKGSNLAGLVEAKDAPLLEQEMGNLTEAVWQNGQWIFYQNGSTLKGDDPLSASTKIDCLVISAPGDVKAAVVYDLVKLATAAQVSRIELLGRRASDPDEVRTISIDMEISGEIEPLLVSNMDDGTFTIGTGASLERIPNLLTLRPMLDIFSAAAQAAGCSPQVLVHHAPEVGYQQLIDAFNECANHNIRLIWNNAANIQPTVLAPIPSIPKPKNGREIEPLGLAPHKDVEPKMKPMPFPEDEEP
jgi:hypothetical protein